MESELLEQPATTEITLPQRAQMALGTAKYELDLLERVQSSCRIVAIKDVAGRNECHAAAMALTRALTSIDKAGKDARDDANKFRDAVIAEVKRLIALGEPEKLRLLALRDAWDEKAEAEKQARTRAEQARIDGHKARINEIHNLVLDAHGKSSKEIGAMIFGLVCRNIGNEGFEEFTEEAAKARLSVLDAMAKAETRQRGIEAEAESQRQERARLEVERAELEVQKAEQERIAADTARKAAEALAEERAAIERERVVQRAEAARLLAIEDAKRRELAEAENARLQLERKVLADAQAEVARQQAEIADAKRIEAARLDAMQREADETALKVAQSEAAIALQEQNATVDEIATPESSQGQDAEANSAQSWSVDNENFRYDSLHDLLDNNI